MRILFLAQRVPYPPNRGDKIPTYHYVRHLARGHEVTVACLADGRGDLANVPGLKAMVHAVEAVPVSSVRAKCRALAALAGTRPLTVAYFDEPELRDRVRRLVDGGSVDAAVVFGSGMAQFVEGYAGLPRVLQFADLDSQKWAQYAAANRIPKRWVYRTEAARLLAYERHLAATFSKSFVCAPRERDDARQLMPEVEIECLPNGVDLDYFRPTPAVEKDPAGLVFTGVMDYFPNADGVEWFCREVLPRVRAEVPKATFTICGSSPTPRVQALGRLPGVSVTGAVPDVRLHLHRASVAVLPLRIARGIQNKLLEAMACGLPAVATPVAFAGVEARPGRDLLVAEGPAAFAAAVVRLLQDARLRNEVGTAARAAVVAGYRWERTLEQLGAAVEAAAGREPALAAVR